MVKRTGPTNPVTRKLIKELRGQENGIWKDVADRLEAPTRNRPEVNLSQIDRALQEGETALVPGKVLASGRLTKGATVAALSFSRSAEEKIEEAGGSHLSLNELLEQNPSGENVRIIA